ncbi:MAG: carboxylate-amine ligase, partial [Planctomycetes bacterium]|nr:carboxylate-amine ligase [Planctomycetota bacterium]
MNPADEIQAFQQIQTHLSEVWTRSHLDPRYPHANVIVPSLSFDQEELQKVAGVPFYEERLLFFLMRLRRPGARLLYVTSQPVDPDIVQYYLQMLVGVPASHAERRLTMLCVYDASPRALTEKILERPRVVQRIRDWLGDRNRAYMTCFHATELERRLSVELGIPVNAADPALSDLGTKSGSRKTFREAGVELSPGFEDLKTRTEIVDALSRLEADAPGLPKAVIKLDDGFSGEGNAIYRYPEDLPRDGDARARAIESGLHRLGFAAEEHSEAEFFRKFEEMGGIVEQFLAGDEVHSPSVQLRITPERELITLSTHDQVLGGASGQVYVGCSFPADPTYRQPIIDRAERIGHVLRERGVVGRFAVDFMATRDAGQDWRFAAVEINLRMGGTTFPFAALQFLTGGRVDENGNFYSLRGTKKFYFATDTLTSLAYRGLL